MYDTDAVTFVLSIFALMSLIGPVQFFYLMPLIISGQARLGRLVHFVPCASNTGFIP